MSKPATLSFTSTLRVESERYPGVTFVLFKKTEGRRIALRLKMLEPQAHLEAVLEEIRQVGELPKDATDAQKLERLRILTPLLQKYERILQDEIHPAWVEWGLKTVEGLNVDGQTINGDNAVDLLPEDMYDEIVEAVKFAGELGPAREKNSGSPTTSSDQVDGRTQPSIADSANSPSSIETETAPSTSPAK